MAAPAHKNSNIYELCSLPHRANEAKRVLRHPYEYVNWFDILFPNEQCVPENVAIERGPDCTNIVHLVNFENIMCFFERGYTHKNFNSFVFCIEFSFILWHDRSLQIKIITLSHKNRAVFPQLLL